MEKRVYIRFIMVFVFVALFFILVFMFFNSDDVSITGGVVGEGVLNENSSDDLGEDLSEDSSDFFRLGEFIKDYKKLMDGWFEVYFSCLNECSYDSEGYIETDCIVDCKSLAGDKESELKKELNEKYSLEEMQYYSSDSDFTALTNEVDSLLVCLGRCLNEKICISECVSDLYGE